MAKNAGARLLLVTVWEGSEPTLLSDLPAVAKDLTESAQRYYMEYLLDLVKQCEADGVQADAEVLIGHPVEQVLEIISQRDPRLLVLATHGRSGLGRWWYGSIAGALLRRAPVTTLAVGPRVLEKQAAPATVKRILVPLDGSSLSESALKPALELAEGFGAEVVIAQVLSWAAQSYMYGVPQVDIGEIDKELTSAAHAYLDRVREGVTTECSVETKVLHGFPADCLTDYVQDGAIDLVVMASHGRGGLARATLGSVADRVLQGAAPVLLVRPAAPAAVEAPARGRYCHACGRAVPYSVIEREDRCLRCGQHLRACGNCVYFDGVACLVQRAEVHDTYPGLNCPEFQFREKPAPQK
jgi:nucleotide-binding universal stress UspA family protein